MSITAAMGRSNSTPGLVESAGKVPLEDMWVSPVEPVKLPGHSATSNSSIPSSEEDKSKNMAHHHHHKLGGLYPSGNYKKPCLVILCRYLHIQLLYTTTTLFSDNLHT